MLGCKLFNHHKHLKLGLLLFQLIYGPYQDFYDLNLLQNTYQSTSHNFLFIFNHSKCDMMLVVFAQIYRRFYNRIFINPNTFMWLHLYVTCIQGLFTKEKLENFLEVGLKLNLNSKLPRALYINRIVQCINNCLSCMYHFLPNQIFNLLLSYYSHFQYNKYVIKSFKLDA